MLSAVTLSQGLGLWGFQDPVCNHHFESGSEASRLSSKSETRHPLQELPFSVCVLPFSFWNARTKSRKNSKFQRPNIKPCCVWAAFCGHGVTMCKNSKNHNSRLWIQHATVSKYSSKNGTRSTLLRFCEIWGMTPNMLVLVLTILKNHGLPVTQRGNPPTTTPPPSSSSSSSSSTARCFSREL